MAHHNRSATVHAAAWMRFSDDFIDGTEIEAQRYCTGGWEPGLIHREHLGESMLDASLA